MMRKGHPYLYATPRPTAGAGLYLVIHRQSAIGGSDV